MYKQDNTNSLNKDNTTNTTNSLNNDNTTIITTNSINNYTTNAEECIRNMKRLFNIDVNELPTTTQSKYYGTFDKLKCVMSESIMLEKVKYVDSDAYRYDILFSLKSRNIKDYALPNQYAILIISLEDPSIKHSYTTLLPHVVYDELYHYHRRINSKCVFGRDICGICCLGNNYISIPWLKNLLDDKDPLFELKSKK